MIWVNIQTKNTNGNSIFENTCKKHFNSKNRFIHNKHFTQTVFFFFLYKAFYYAFAYSFEIFKDEGDN